MKKQTLVHSSVLAAVVIAAVVGVSMVSGFTAAKQFISVDPVSDKNTGDAFTLTGNTSLPAGSEILVDIHPSSLDLKTGMIADPATGAPMRLDDSMVATGLVTVDKKPDGVTVWSFDIPSKKFPAGEYTATACVYDKNEPGPGGISGTTRFTVHGSQASTVSGQFIRVDPVGDKNVGDRFNVTGTTNLPTGTKVLFQAYPASFEPGKTDPQTGAQSGEFTGATGIVTVAQGTGGENTWSADLDLTTFMPMEYLVNVSLFTGDVRTMDFSTGNPSGRITFTVRPSSGNTGTAPQSDKAVAGGILIDPIRDTISGRLLEVTGKTSLSAGTDLLVKVVPVTVQNGKITGDYQNPENVVMTKVVKGNGVNNRFSVNLDTRLLPVTDHIVTISTVKGTAAGIDSEPGMVTGSQVFNILADTARTVDAHDNTSVPCIFINPLDEITAGDSLIVSGTTNLPAGAKLRVSVIPASSTDYEHPELTVPVSVVKGSPAVNLFSVPLATKSLPKEEHILLVSAEDAQVTGSILFTVE